MTATIGSLRALLGAGMAESLRLDRLNGGQLHLLGDDVLDVLAAVCEERRRRQTNPRGQAQLRLVAAKGDTLLTGRELAAQRRRKPIHVRNAS